MTIQYNVAYPYFPEEEIDPILEQFKSILKGDAMLSMGANVKAFENEFASYCGSSFGVATNSCSAALEISLRTLQLQKTDEVILPAETFIATGASVIREGGKVVFAEIDPQTFCLSAASVRDKITPHTKAVIVVHMAGLVTPDILEIVDICKQNNLILIEDVAHAPGAEYQGQKAGSFGDFGCFSFYSTKVITAAEGGMLVTSNEEFYKQANSFRNRGLDLQAKSEQYIGLGTNNRMTEFSAILGRSQFKHLDSFINHRNKIASLYHNALKDHHLVSPLPLPEKCHHSYWRYIVKLDKGIDRYQLREDLKEVGVAIDWAYDPPLHLQPFFKKTNQTEPGDLPVTEEAMKHFVCLPIHMLIKEKDAQTISQLFIQAISKQHHD